MITFIFLAMIAMMAVAAIFIAIQAKGRGKPSRTSATVAGEKTPVAQRAIPDND